MGSKIDGLQVSFLDAKELMVDAHADNLITEQKQCTLQGYGKVDCWILEPRFLICIHGIFIDLSGIEGLGLTGGEYEERLHCPRGDPITPIVTFPCTLRELKESLESVDAAELIYPFDMAEWVGRKLGSSSQSAHEQDNADSTRSLDENEELHPKRKDTCRSVIATLLAMQYSTKEMEQPYKLADQVLDDCQTQNIKAPASRNTLGGLFKQLPLIQKAPLD